MTYQRWTRIALAYLAARSLEIGVWAQFAAACSFDDNFPGLGSPGSASTAPTTSTSFAMSAASTSASPPC